VGNIGAGASSGTEREVLKEDGNADACAVANQSDADAPQGCGALLRVEVVPIDRIFGGTAATDTSGGTSPSSGGPSTDTSPELTDPEYAKKRKLWAALTGTGYALAIGGIGALYGGIAVRKKGSDALPDSTPGADRQDALGKVNLGNGLLIGGAVGASLGLVLAVFANAKLKSLKARQSASIGPSLYPGGGGVSAQVRF
jgi:hypothetical protein